MTVPIHGWFDLGSLRVPGAESLQEPSAPADMGEVEVIQARHRLQPVRPSHDARSNLLVGIIPRARVGWRTSFDVLLYERAVVLVRARRLAAEVIGFSLGLPVLGVGALPGSWLAARLARSRDAARLSRLRLSEPEWLGDAGPGNAFIAVEHVGDVRVEVARRWATVHLDAPGRSVQLAARMDAYPQDVPSVLRRVLPSVTVDGRPLRRMWRRALVIAGVAGAELGAAAALFG